MRDYFFDDSNDRHGDAEFEDWVPSMAPGKVTLTSRIVRVATAAAGNRRQSAAPKFPPQPAQCTPDGPAQTAIRPEVLHWMNVAVRPDLHSAPAAHPSPVPVQRKQKDGLEGDLSVPQPSGSGAELGEDVRADMETAFGADFSAVRIHEGPQAESLGALAYTQGSDIHFQPGQYNPHSAHGRELLGHELAHVVQQSQRRVPPTGQARGAEVNSDPSLEGEADDMGARAARSERVASRLRGGASDARSGQRERSVQPEMASRIVIPTGRSRVIQYWEGKEHKSAGDGAQNQFPFRGQINTRGAALHSSPAKDRQNLHRNTVATLARGTPVVATAKHRSWIRVVVAGGAANGKSGYISNELITRDEQTFDAHLTVGGMDVSYGDTVAMGGDHFEGFADFEIEASSDPGQARIERLRGHIDSESVVGGDYQAPDYASDNTVSAGYAERYKELALENVAHFSHGGVGLTEWQRQHRDAVAEALQGGLRGDIERLERAFAMNGVADHFLTDSFSAGHIRVPRARGLEYYEDFADAIYQPMMTFVANQIGDRLYAQLPWTVRVGGHITGAGARERARTRVRETIDDQVRDLENGEATAKDLLGKYLAGAFAKILHDMDNEQGLVVNSDGHSGGWTALGDGKLRDAENAENRAIMMRALQSSKQDVTAAFNLGLDIYTRQGTEVTGAMVEQAMARLQKTVGPPFQAMQLVPRAAPQAPELPDWQWGQLSPAMRGKIASLIVELLDQEAQQDLLNLVPENQDVEDDAGDVVATVRPRQAVRELLTEFLADPVAFLERAFGQPASQ
ncbi:MAG: DUF4157 domain-containing protein [Proteobacteria bacterium]|nr:DUF4157 domain-containing protein [Pseudomonadota bacterium]